MVQSTGSIVFSVPRSVLSSIAELSVELSDRMHKLLEKNTNGRLASTEKAELKALIRITECGQIVSMALEP